MASLLDGCQECFLHGDLQETMYMTPPPGYACLKGSIWKLQKSLFGLKQAP